MQPLHGKDYLKVVVISGIIIVPLILGLAI